MECEIILVARSKQIRWKWILVINLMKLSKGESKGSFIEDNVESLYNSSTEAVI